jgi:hypothetical protein
MVPSGSSRCLPVLMVHQVQIGLRGARISFSSDCILPVLWLHQVPSGLAEQSGSSGSKW